MDKSGGESNILMFDLGGGTFIVTLLATVQRVVDVLGTSGDTHLRCGDINQRVVQLKERVVQFFIKMMTNKSNVESILQRIYIEADCVKRVVSFQQRTYLGIEDLGKIFDPLTSAGFEELNNHSKKGVWYCWKNNG